MVSEARMAYLKACAEADEEYQAAFDAADAAYEAEVEDAQNEFETETAEAQILIAEAQRRLDVVCEPAYKRYVAAKNPLFIIWQDKLQAAMAQYKREAKQ